MRNLISYLDNNMKQFITFVFSVFFLLSFAFVAQAVTPTIINFSPTVARGDDFIRLTGSNFVAKDIAGVYFGTYKASSFNVESADVMFVRVPTKIADAKYDIEIRLRDGSFAESSSTLTINNSITTPSVTSFSPTVAKSDDLIKVTGARFVQKDIESIYLLNSVVDYWFVESSTTLYMKVPLKMSDGKYSLRFNMKDGSVVRAPGLLTVDSTTPITINSIAPYSANHTQVITLGGTGFSTSGIADIFMNTRKINWNLINNNLLNFSIPDSLPKGTYSVRVVTSSGQNLYAPLKVNITDDGKAPDKPMTITSFPGVTATGDVINIDGDLFEQDLIKAVSFSNTVPEVFQAEWWDVSNPKAITAKIPENMPLGDYTIIIDTVYNQKYSATSPMKVDSVGKNANTDPTNNSNDPSDPKPSAFTFSGLVPNCNKGDIDPTTKLYETPCGIDALVALVNKVINFLLVVVGTPLAAIIFAYAGFLYLTSGGNAEKANKGKGLILKVLFGYVIALSAWLIIKTILWAVGFDDAWSFLV